MQHQFLGLARFLKRRAVEMPVVCQLMFEPDWTPWGEASALAHRAYRRAFTLLRNYPAIRFTCETAALVELYKRAFDVDCTILPTPIEKRDIFHPVNERVRLGYFGYSKKEKGYHLLPRAISLCAEMRPDLEFVIQAQHGKGIQEIDDATFALRGMPGVRVLEGALSAAQYERQVRSSDIVLLPYDPEYFGIRGSGVYADAVSGGLPIVAASGTWAARCVTEGRAVGEVFAPYDSASFARAILAVCANLAP